MSPARHRSLFFLPCQQGTTTPHTTGQLDSEARTHVWRQSMLKAAHHRRELKFVPSTYSAETTHTTPVAAEIKKLVDGPDSDQEEGALIPPSQVTYVPTDIPPNPGPDGSLDSLSSLALGDFTQNEKFLLHYAFNRTLPVFGESDDGKQSFAQSWISRSLASPMVLNAQISGASTHYMISTSVGRPTHPFFTAGLKGKIRAIQALQIEIDRHQSGSAVVNNDLLLAMFILAIHGGLNPCDQPEPHPLSPLATHRDLNVYGRMTFCEEHTNALYYLVEKSGGLSCLDQAAFHCVLPVWDLVNSSRKGSRPRFPSTRQAKPIIHSGLWDPDKVARRQLSALGKAFQQRPDRTWPLFLTSTMAQRLLVMAEITAALDHFSRGSEGAPKSLDVLLNNCDWAAYEILSLRPDRQGLRPVAPDGEILDPSPAALLREICRLSALLYIDMVIFPLPPHSGIKARLSKGILRWLKVFERLHSSEDMDVSDFLIWATFLGAIATRFTGLHLHYRDRIAMIARNMHWDAVLRKLEQHLWFGPVFDRPAIKIWAEASQTTKALSPVDS